MAVVEVVGWVVAVASCDVIADWVLVIDWIVLCVVCKVFMVWAVVENVGWDVSAVSCDLVIVD